MIQFTRTAKPNVLVQNAENWTTEYLQAKENYNNLKTSESKNILKNIENRYKHIEVKASLKTMFQKKCAFCESHITHIDYGQIEHFKPKSKYPEFCFEWNNFLLSCAICNGKSNKGDKFPLENENGSFINPVDENPNEFFKFEFDEVTNKFLIFPKNERAFTTIKELGLNRENLSEFRTNELSKITFVINEIINKNKEELLDKFISQFSQKDQFYAFIKTIFEKVK